MLARNLDEFLKSAPRKPVAFYNEAGVGTLDQLMARAKSYYDPKYYTETKEQSDEQVESAYKYLMPWQDRVSFDEQTADTINWHFSLELLTAAARNQNVPDYLRRSLLLAAWTRAILLNKDDGAVSLAGEVIKVAPEMSSAFEPYLKARSVKGKHYAALYALLQFPELSPYVKGTFFDSSTTEQLDYYLESAWWSLCMTIRVTKQKQQYPRLRS